MTVCRRDCRRTWPFAALLAAAVAVTACGDWARAAESPVGRIISSIVPVNNRAHPADQILTQMHSRPGKAYDESVIQEDVRRLHATRWFIPGGVQIHTKNDADGRVTVFVYLTELTSTVQDVEYQGAQHLSLDKLQTLTGVRKGDPMNPLANELGRQAILREYQDEGRYFASVELIEGGKPTDTRVIYRVVEGPKVAVSAIEFRGNDEATTGRLKTQLATKKKFLGLFGGKFNPASLDADLQKLRDYYHGLGYLAVQITPEVVRTEDLGKVKIVYHIVEGQQYQVTDVQIAGNKTLPIDRLQSWTDLKPGERYDRWVVQADKQRIEDGYGIRGHRIGVEEQVFEVPGEPGNVRVVYQVVGDRGQGDRIGNIYIQGNTVTQDRVIMNQLSELGILPGQILPYPRLEDARIRLARLGIFDPANPPEIIPLPTEFDEQFKDILVRVQETRTGQFMIGGGVNSNAGVNASIVLNERNFDLFRFPTSWDDFRMGRAFRGAGQELRIEAVPGTVFQRYSVTFREPYLLDTPFGLTTSGYYFNRAYAEYNEDRVGGRFTIDRRLDPIWRASLTTRVEGVQVKDVPFYATPAITDDIGWHFLLGLRGGITRDTRDSYIFPTTGSVLDVGYEQVLGDYTFPIGTAEYTKFLSSEYFQREDGSGKHVLAIRSQLGIAGQDAPVFERFFAGGFRSLRGFTFRGVGPSENFLFTGGTFSFLNTIEYQIPILQNDKLFFVTFLDHGTVEDDVAIRDYRVSAGFGFRIAVPALGPLPIALDFAFPLNKRDTDNEQLFSFYVGLFGGN